MKLRIVQSVTNNRTINQSANQLDGADILFVSNVLGWPTVSCTVYCLRIIIVETEERCSIEMLRSTNKNRRKHCDNRRMLLLLMKMALILILYLFVFVPHADSQISTRAERVPIGKS